MLEKIDLKKKVDKDFYNKEKNKLGELLGKVQRDVRTAKKPVIIVFEGWRGGRRSEIINTMMQQMDARGFNVLSSVRMGTDEVKQPLFSYYWKNLPALGNITVYHRSWYYHKNSLEMQADPSDLSDKNDAISYEHINKFEKLLTDDKYIIIKFFLHISEEQQKENIARNEKTFGKAWREVNSAIDETGHYREYLKRYDKMLEVTDKANAPWHIIAADDRRSAVLDIFHVIIDTINKALVNNDEPATDNLRQNFKYDVLGKVQASREMSREEYKEKLDKYQKRLRQLQIEMFQKGIPTVIGFEGWDAAGKGGAIRRLTAALDPLGFRVHPIAAPNAVEREYNYQWRFWTKLPEAGNVAIFDRTWYGRLMVERLEGFAKPYEWQRAYDEIKDMEAQWAESGVAIAKFWLQIDKNEQLKRFNERKSDPLKQWKITDEDWRNRDKWDAYEEAINEMLVRTDTSYAPWTVVEGNNKYYARIKVLKTIIDLFERKLNKKD